MMEGFPWGALLAPLLYAPAALTAVASTIYAARVRSRAAVAMAIGALGVLAGGVSSLTFNIVVVPRLNPETGNLANIFGYVSAAFGIWGFAFGLLFSVSLLIVLREAWRRAAEPQSATPSEPVSHES